ncbi:conserved domain protein [Actinomyces sp. oral taxon 170 str. F0386]|nr:conserved domain protein [Actinomyces sp. oral taxon 170 str. F0386]
MYIVDHRLWYVDTARQEGKFQKTNFTGSQKQIVGVLHWLAMTLYPIRHFDRRKLSDLAYLYISVVSEQGLGCRMSYGYRIHGYPTLSAGL